MNKEAFWKNKIVVVVGALVCCLLWGSAFPCVKIGKNLFGVDSSDVPSIILFAGARFTLAGLLILMIGSIGEKKILLPQKRNWKDVFVLAIFQTWLQYIFYYIGLANTPGVTAAIINGLNVFLTILVSCFIFRQEKFTLKLLVGCVLGFGGILVLQANNFTASAVHFSIIGEGFLMISALASAFASGFIKEYSKEESPVVLSGWQFFIGGAILVLGGLLFGGKLTVTSVFAVPMLFYLAFISAVAFSLWGILLKYNDVSTVSAFKTMNPVFGVLLSAAFLPEERGSITYFTCIALLLVLVGIYIINTRKRKKKTPPES